MTTLEPSDRRPVRSPLQRDVDIIMLLRLGRVQDEWEKPSGAERTSLRARMYEAVRNSQERSAGGAAAAAWPGIWCAWRTEHRIDIAVRYAMHMAKILGIELPKDRAGSAHELRNRLSLDLPEFEGAVAGTDEGGGAGSARYRAIRALERHGAAQAPTAVRAIRRGARGTADSGHDPSWPARLLALVWLERLGAERPSPSGTIPALPLLVTAEIVDTLWGPTTTVRHRGSEVHLQRESRTVATVATIPGVGLERIEADAHLARLLTAHRLIRHVVRVAHDQAANGAPEPSRVEVDGGLIGLAHAIGARSRKAADEVLAVLRFGQMFRRVWSGGEAGGLWTYSTDDFAAPARRSCVEIRLGAMLLPRYVYRLPKDRRSLVPVPPIPPLIGRPRDHGAQAAFQIALIAAMVERRTELVRRGGAHLSEGDLLDLAGSVGLPSGLIPRVIDRWVQDGDDGLACLERVDRDRYHLANNPAYAEARAFLDEGGRRSIAGARAGRAGTAARRRRLAGRSRR